METLKIQTELLKGALNKKAHEWYLELTDDEVIILTVHQMWLLEHSEFLLDDKKLLDAGVKTITTSGTLLDGYKDAKPLTKTAVKRVFGKTTCIELKLNDEAIYVDEALLKYYDKSAEFEGTGKHQPVYVYEGELLVGLVLPFKVV